MSAKIWGFGSACIDFRITTIDMGKDYTEKLLAQETNVMGGGATANCLTQIARLGGEAYYIGCLGTDWIGDKIVDLLRMENINCSNIIYKKDQCSPFNVAVYADGVKRRRVGGYLLANSLRALDFEDIDILAKDIKKDDFLIIEIGETKISDVVKLCNIAKAKGAKIAIDVDLDPVMQCNSSKEAIFNIFTMADLLIPNIGTMNSLFEFENTKQLAEKIAEKCTCDIVITLGAEGCLLYKHESQVISLIPAILTQAIDTVGAGDAFHGGLIYGMAQDYSIEKSIDIATFCASENCKAFGARTGMIRLEALKKRTYLVEIQ